MVADARGGAGRGARAAEDRPALSEIHRSLFENAVGGLAFHEIVLDAGGRPVDYVFLAVNAAFEAQTGLARDAVVGRRVTEALPGIEHDPADWIGRYGRVALTGEPVKFQQFSASLERWYDVTAFSPRRGYFAVAFSDVTEHRRLADALRESERRLRARSRDLHAVLDATHAQLALLDPELRFLLVNDAYARACGRPREALLGRGHFELFPHAENEAIFRRVLATGEPFYAEEKPFEDPGQTARGVTWWNWSLVPVPGEDGRVSGVLLSLLDVTGQVVARKAVEELAAERERAEEALREADRRKTAFLAVLSHELRNPLAPIHNALWLLDRAEPGGDRARGAREIVGRQVAHLTRLVDDLLDVTRISRGRIELQRTRVDLVELVHRTAEDYRSLLADRGVALVERRPDRPVWADADPTRISQAVGNLFQNAAKFCDRGGKVEVSVAREPDGAAAIRVRDDGAGIPTALLDRIFEPFTQADESLHRSRGGLGLGLSLVKAFAELHGGSVEARSEGPGRGAEFLVRLPAAPGPRELAGSPAPAGEVAPRRVLVVEDNRDAAETLAAVLATWGHDVAVAYDGLEGLVKARTLRPDLVLCDIDLPVLDGYGLARAVRADPALAPVSLVALTGYSLPEDRRRVSDAGFDRHLAKPVSPERLADLVAATAPRPPPGGADPAPLPAPPGGRDGDR